MERIADAFIFCRLSNAVSSLSFRGTHREGGSRKYTQVLKQYLKAHKNQYHTAQQLRAGFIFCAEQVPKLDANAGKDKCNHTDAGNCSTA